MPPSASAVSAATHSASPSLVGAPGLLTALSLPPLLRSQTVVSPKHSGRRVDATRQPSEERRESELGRTVAGGRGGRRSESLLVGGRLAELGRRRVKEDSSVIELPAERERSEPLQRRQSVAQQRPKVEEDERIEERAQPALPGPLISPSSTAIPASAIIDSVASVPAHRHRPSLASFASSPLSITSDRSASSTPSASSARLSSSFASLTATSTSDSTTPNKRQTRRKLRAAESSMREAAELASEGDIDSWVEAVWPLERSKEEEAERRRREGGRLGRVEVAVSEDHNRPHRQSMEDAYTVCLAFNPPDSPPDHPASSFFAVYDGHGGTFASTYAKRHLHRLFAKHLSLQHSDSAVQAAFEAAFSELSDVMGRSKRFMSCGTTAVCCYVQQLLDSTVVHCANIGDAQAFLFSSPSDSTRLSTLHTAHNAAECVRIEEAGGHILLNRVNGVLAVTRALGDNGMHKAGLIAQPAYSRVELTASPHTDRWWLLLCCDGVSDVLSEAELRPLVVSAGASEASAVRAASKVVAESLLHQSTDNITVCVVRIDTH